MRTGSRLKYLYLAFLDNDPIDLEKWVFGIETHPLFHIGYGPWYRRGLGKGLYRRVVGIILTRIYV